MKIRKAIASLGLLVIVPTVAACGADAATSSATDRASSSAADTSEESSTESDSTDTDGDELPAEPPAMGEGGGGDSGSGGPGGSVDASSVSTEAELVALIQDAYGDAGLGLHRGHQPVQDVLDEVLTISHDELHVRMEEQGQNLAAVAEDIDVDPQTLIDALVDSRSTAIDNLLDAGTITQEEADAYSEALTEAFTFRVTWDGEAETPTFSGLET